MNEAIIANKKEQVVQVADRMQASSSLVIVNYRGLTVEKITELRHKLRETGSEMRIVKNNILRRAAEQLGQKELMEMFVGPSAIVYGSEDVVAPAKVISEFAKANKQLEIKAGVIEGQFADLATINELAALPSREGLLTMLAGAMLSPLRDITIGLHMLTEEEEQAEA